MSDRPRLLVIEREPRAGAEGSARAALDAIYEVTSARTLARALALLGESEYAGVLVDRSQLAAVQSTSAQIQAVEVLEAIADGVAIVDTNLVVLWANPEFARLCPTGETPSGRGFHHLLSDPETIGPDPSPFLTAIAARGVAQTVLKLSTGCYLRVTVTPVFDASGALSQLIALTRDVTAEVHQQQKIDAIHKAGEELADLRPEDLASMGVEERTELVKYNIVRHMKDLLGLDFLEIRLLERATDRLVPLLTEGMTPLAADRELFARKTENGVTGFVAATGQSYLCPDTTNDPLYLEGAAGARSSLTVPLMYNGTLIGTLNVESAHANGFDDRDRQFLEIYARSVAAALMTLELLDEEKRQVASKSLEAFTRELALPLDEILGDATIVLDRYGGHDEDIIARLKHVLNQAREIRSLIPRVASTLAPESRSRDRVIHPRKFEEKRVLVVDAEEAIRHSAHTLLDREGATVETADSAQEALAMARQSPYATALVDIRLPDMEGYEVYRQLREIQPGLPVILMTGFGYDASHAIVKARRDGLQTVLYKPFRADRLIEAVEQAFRVSANDRPAQAETPPGQAGGAVDSVGS